MNYYQNSSAAHIRKKCGFVVSSEKPNEKHLNQDLLMDILNYDPDTGIFIWKSNRGGKASMGATAGNIGNSGYRRIEILNRTYRASRLAFLYMTGEWPTQQVDHINRIRHDDRWSNLRDVSSSQNNRNRSPSVRTNRCGSPHKTRSPWGCNKTGIGVCWHKRSQKWRAQINVSGKKLWIGEFSNKIDAIKARLNKEMELNYYGDKKFESQAYKAFFQHLIEKY